MGNTKYANAYRDIDFRQQPHKYVIGKGEQGVLIAEPYKSEILPHWRFATEAIAKKSATKIYKMFKQYKSDNDFVGMDMARKFLQMGFTRSRRYANHSTGKKYTADGNIKPQDADSEQSEKARSAKVFYEYYVKAREDPKYKDLKTKHKELQKIK